MHIFGMSMPNIRRFLAGYAFQLTIPPSLKITARNGQKTFYDKETKVVLHLLGGADRSAKND